MNSAARRLALAEGAAAVSRMQARARAACEAAADPLTGEEAAAVAAARGPRRLELRPDTVRRHLAQRRPPFTLGLTMRDALELAARACEDDSCSTS